MKQRPLDPAQVQWETPVQSQAVYPAMQKRYSAAKHSLAATSHTGSHTGPSVNQLQGLPQPENGYADNQAPRLINEGLYQTPQLWGQQMPLQAPATVGPFHRERSASEGYLADPYQQSQTAVATDYAPSGPIGALPANHSTPALPLPPALEAAVAAGIAAPISPQQQKTEEDITISFKPKIALVKGKTVSQVRLVLADFEGEDADYIKLESMPHRAFIGAYWTSKTKELALILGRDVPAHTPVSIMIPASSGIRRVVKTDEGLGGQPGPGGSSVIDVLEQSARAREETSPLSVRDDPADAQERMLEQGNEVDTPACDKPEMEEMEEEHFCDIPEVETQEAAVSQAEWARRQLERGSNAPEMIKTVDLDDVSNKIAEQSKAAKQQLQNRSEVTKTSYDAESVAEQSRWAKEQLENRKDTTQKTLFDAEAVGAQARSAMESLSNLPQKEAEIKFDAQSVADQAKWARMQLENRPERAKTTVFDAASLSEQAQWAKQKLFNPEVAETDEYAAVATQQTENNHPNSPGKPSISSAQLPFSPLQADGADPAAAAVATQSKPAETEAEIAEKKRRAMQKRLEFLAAAETNKSADSSVAASDLAPELAPKCGAAAVASEFSKSETPAFPSQSNPSEHELDASSTTPAIMQQLDSQVLALADEALTSQGNSSATSSKASVRPPPPLDAPLPFPADFALPFPGESAVPLPQRQAPLQISIPSFADKAESLAAKVLEDLEEGGSPSGLPAPSKDNFISDEGVNCLDITCPAK